mgnify:CR=1 FL=1
MIADLQSLGLAQRRHPVESFRNMGAHKDCIALIDLVDKKDRDVVEVIGLVTHMQAPGTARGMVFLTLEDETAMLNVACFPAMWKKQHKKTRDSKLVKIRGILEKVNDVTSLRAALITPLTGESASLLRSHAILDKQP